MSKESITSIKPDILATWMKGNKNDFIVVDVRDVDYSAFKIPGSIHVPSDILMIGLAKLIEDIAAMKEKPKYVVFYCMHWFVTLPCAVLSLFSP